MNKTNQSADQIAPVPEYRPINQTVTLVLLDLLLAAMPAPARANGDKATKKIIPFTDARLRIELNAAEGDSGLHALLDAEGWQYVRIYDPRGSLVFHVAGGGSVRKSGLAELIFESAELGFEELPLEEFLKRFQAGQYLCVGTTTGGDTLFSIATLTHALPDEAVLLSPPDGSVQDPNNIVVQWAPLPDPAGSRSVRYEVFVVEDGSVSKRVLSAVLPATQTSMAIPAAILTPNCSNKWAILAIEAGGNQTLSEASFRIP